MRPVLSLGSSSSSTFPLLDFSKRVSRSFEGHAKIRTYIAPLNNHQHSGAEKSRRHSVHLNTPDVVTIPNVQATLAHHLRIRNVSEVYIPHMIMMGNLALASVPLERAREVERQRSGVVWGL